jgi:hypothetical protein
MKRLSLMLVCLWFVSVGVALGQPPEDPTKRPRMDTNPAPAAPGQSPPPMPNMVKQATKPFYVQGAVVALLTGGAVWTVCRSGNRQ